jgi:hypothetical protein
VSASGENHGALMTAAIERDGAAQRALFAGDRDLARAEFAESAELYRRSWEAAGSTSYGRLIGMLKAAVLAGGGGDQAAYAASALARDDSDSAAAAYVHALAALIAGDDEAAGRWAAQMRGGSDAFDRTAEAIDALARRDGARYADAVQAIVRDFEQRSDHLTGVAIADTALMLEDLAARRGMSSGIESPVLPSRAR